MTWGRTGDEVLQSEYREEKSSTHKGSNLWNTSGATCRGRNKRRGLMIVWQRSWCSGQGLRILGHSDLFKARGDLHKRAGLKLSWRGDQYPGRNICENYSAGFKLE